MSNYELLKKLIADLEHNIDDYTYEICQSNSDIERHNFKLIRFELTRWKRSLETMLLELED